MFEEDAVFQDKGVLAEGGGLERVVGDEQESDVRLGDELLDFTEELRLDGGVEAGEGLIEQEQPGAHGEGHTLLLADRQGGRFAPGEGIDAAGLQGGMGAGDVFGAGQAAIGQAEEDILLGGEVGPQGQVLEYQGYVTFMWWPKNGAGCGDSFPGHRDAATGRRIQTGDEA